MHIRSISMTVLAAALAAAALSACSEDRGNDRWATTSNTTVDIDWDKVQEAYRTAEGPQDFENKINEIYTGDELISVSVQDKDAKVQEVTGFFDRNGNGQVEEPEKIFVIKRDVVGQDKAQYAVQGYGHYAGYHHTSMWDIAGGMLIGSMLANALMPSYRPMYTTPYTTSPSRLGQIGNYRSDYRAKNPSRFSSPGKASGSGRSYGSTGSSGRSWGSSGSSGRSSGGRSSGGGRFGLDRRRRRDERVVHLDA